MFYRLMMLFILIPLGELIILIKVGKYLGTMNTIGLIILTGVVGASFARQQGAGILIKIRESMAQGQMPGEALLQGLMILIGGVLLITPGFITDLVGFSLLIPITRQYFTRLAVNYIKKRLESRGFSYTTEGSDRQPADENDNRPQIP